MNQKVHTEPLYRLFTEGDVVYDKHLDGFICVVECGSFAKASEQLFISPNALIKQVNILERDLGIILLERTNNGVNPTPAGAFIYKEAKKMTRESQEMLSQARRIAGDEVQTIRLGVSQLRSPKVVTAMWKSVQDKHPTIKIFLTNIPDDINYWPKILLELGTKADIVIGVHPSPDWNWYDKCEVRDIYQSMLLCMVPLGHPLCGRSRIALTDLEGEVVRIVHEGAAPSNDTFRRYIGERHPTITIKDYDPYDIQSYNEIVEEGTIAFCHEEWEGFHPSFEYIPFAEKVISTVSLIYSRECKTAVSEFVEAICSLSSVDGLSSAFTADTSFCVFPAPAGVIPK